MVLARFGVRRRIDRAAVPLAPALRAGATASVIGSTFYAYGRYELDGYVARVPLAQITTPGAWEFWGNAGTGGADGWVTDPQQAVPMTFIGRPGLHPDFGSGAGPGAPLSVRPHGTGYLGTAMLLDAFSDEVSTFTAPAPEGPWTYHGRIHTSPSTSTPGDDLSSYGALLPYRFAGAPGPTVMYSTNDTLIRQLRAAAEHPRLRTPVRSTRRRVTPPQLNRLDEPGGVGGPSASVPYDV